MKSFKSVLTILFLLCTIGGSASGEDQAELRGADGSRRVAPGIAAGTDYIGYAWPFPELDLAKEISRPVVVELFSTQGCMFSPVADRFFHDLLAKAPQIIGLSCHVDFIKIDPRNPALSLAACTDRQNAYATARGGAKTYTPQIVVNGLKESYGFSFDAVLENLRAAQADPPALLKVSASGKKGYIVRVPGGNFSGAHLEVLTYRIPLTQKIVGGQNDEVTVQYERVVTSISAIPDWEKQGPLVPLGIKPGQDDAGAVVLLRQPQGGIVAVGEILFSAP